MKKVFWAMWISLILFAPTANAQDTLSRADFVKAVFKAALISNSPDTVSGDLYRVQVDSTTIMWSEDFGFGKVWLKGDPTGFTFKYTGYRWVFVLNDEVNQRLQGIDEPYVIETLKKIKKKN